MPKDATERPPTEDILFEPKPIGLPSRLRVESSDALGKFNGDDALKKDQDVKSFDSFHLGRWHSELVAGRDICVTIVRKGRLFPFGFPVRLVRVFERRIRAEAAPSNAAVELVQCLYITADHSRSNCLSELPDNMAQAEAQGIRLLAIRTPNLVNPDDDAFSYGNLNGKPRPSPAVRDHGLKGQNLEGSTDGDSLPSLLFWPRTQLDPSSPLAFDIAVDGLGEPMKSPLFFVDENSTNDPEIVKGICNQYFGEITGGTSSKRLTDLDIAWRFNFNLLANDKSLACGFSSTIDAYSQNIFVSAHLSLQIEKLPDGVRCCGHATFSFSLSAGLHSVDFAVQVARERDVSRSSAFDAGR